MKRVHLLVASVILTVLLIGAVAFLIVDMHKYETSQKEISELVNNIQNDLNEVGSSLESSKENDDDSVQIRTINQDNVELKSEPNLNSETLRTFVSGENVFPTNFISYNEDEYWVQVTDRNGQKGWVLEERLK